MDTVSLSEILASFNFVGYAGSQGNIGFTGSQGAGFTGSQGATGFVGSQGLAGFSGSKGDTGLGFTIAKTYASVAALTADTSPTGIAAGQFAIIDTGNVNDAENSRLYLWTGSAYNYVNDLSGAIGLTGPQGNAGFTGSQGTTGFAGSAGSAGFTGSSGSTGFTGSAGTAGNIGFTGSSGSAATFTSNTAPVSPSVGSFWYRPSTDVLYQYLNTGSGNYWIDITAPDYDFGIGDADQTLINDSNTPNGQIAYTTAGTYSWTAPQFVTKVCVVCVGGGGQGAPVNSQNWYAGGGGGGLGWKNNITVVPGQTYTVVVGAGGSGSGGLKGTDGGNSYFIDTSTVMGMGGTGGSTPAPPWGPGGSWVGDGGGKGGDALKCGGGAGGYGGTNPDAGRGAMNHFSMSANPGEFGGGGGGGSIDGSGGGVGILGQGSDGAANGGGGSGGGGGGFSTGATGGSYGGGGAGGRGNGGGGAVRIIWGPGRAFPSTLTGDL